MKHTGVHLTCVEYAPKSARFQVRRWSTGARATAHLEDMGRKDYGEMVRGRTVCGHNQPECPACLFSYGSEGLRRDFAGHGAV